ncbi:hypothetical protein [Sinomicrobium oceani]|uniref:hypothetical protein n=1 Tax=Sinomicrobium oceani TaxID=1150368 RepID=UPI00227B832C|nr:hypothetical protein [Sinomicrobium oceani]
MEELLKEFFEHITQDPTFEQIGRNKISEDELIDKFLAEKETKKYIKAEAKRLGFFSLWFHTDDIINRGNDLGVEVTQKQAQEIAIIIEKNGDCEAGINWDSIYSAIENYFGIEI